MVRIPSRSSRGAARLLDRVFRATASPSLRPLVALCLVPSLLVLASGCVSRPVPRVIESKTPPPRLRPVSIDEILEMSDVGIPPAEIIRRLKKRQPIFTLTLHEVLLLREARVPDQVIDYVIRPRHLFPPGTVSRPSPD